VLDVIAIFGAGRCMFASNFPVDRAGLPPQLLVRSQLRRKDSSFRTCLFRLTARCGTLCCFV
jgi:hypothetical protein